MFRVDWSVNNMALSGLSAPHAQRGTTLAYSNREAFRDALRRTILTLFSFKMRSAVVKYRKCHSVGRGKAWLFIL
jgi:hypothetical protein